MQPLANSTDGWATAHTMLGVGKAEASGGAALGVSVLNGIRSELTSGLHFWAQSPSACQAHNRVAKRSLDPPALGSL